MADEKKDEVIELVAVERGFAMGKLIEPGAKFKFRVHGADGKQRKLPKWARLPSEPAPTKAPAKNSDLKPADTQAAVATKRGQIGDSLV